MRADSVQPYTIGLALNDSPIGIISCTTLSRFYSFLWFIGLLIWIGEKYHTREPRLYGRLEQRTTDIFPKIDTDPSYDIPPSFLIATISIYYHTHSFVSSCLPYYENTTMFGAKPARITDSVLGVSVFDHDILVMPRRWIASWHKKKLAFWKYHLQGGHFRASELGGSSWVY